MSVISWQGINEISKGNRYGSTFIFVFYGFYNQLLKKNQSFVFSLVFAYFASQFGLCGSKKLFITTFLHVFVVAGAWFLIILLAELL